MSDDTIRIPIETPANISGAEKAIRALERLARAAGGAASAQGRGASADATADRAAQERARSIRQLEQALARQARQEQAGIRQAQQLADSEVRAARAAGDHARALELVEAQLGRAAAGTARYNNLLAQKSRIEASQARQQGGGGFAAQFGSEVGDQLGSMVGPAAIAGVTVAAAASAVELGKAGAQAELVRQRFNGLAEAAGTTGDALMRALRSASGGEINDLNLQLAANRAQLLGVADSAEEFSTLMAIARDRAQQMGISTEQAFNDLVTGLGRGSALILDNLGITVSVTEANEAYAASLGKTVSQLTEAEQKTALINAVLTQGKASLDATGGAAESNAGKIERFGATMDNLKNKIGGELAAAATPTLDVISGLLNAFDGSTESVLRYVDAANAYLGANEQVAEVNKNAAAWVLNLLGLTDDQAEASQRSAGAWGEEAKAVEDAGAAKAIARAEAELLAEKENALYDAAQAAAAGSGSIEDAAARLAAKFPIAAGEAEKLIALLRELAGLAGVPAAAAGRARIAAQGMNTRSSATGTFGGSNEPVKNAPGRTGAGDDQIAQVAAAQKAAKEAADAQRAYDEAVGGTSVRLRNLRSDLAGATAGSAEYYRIAAEIANLEDRQGRAGGAAASRAAKAADKDAREAERAAEQADDIQYKQAERQRDILNKRVAAAQERDAQLADIEKTSAADLAQIAADAASAQTEIEAQASSKLADIRKQRAANLKAIDERAAAEQAQAARDLASTIAGTQAGLRAANAADNLALAGAGDDPALKAREAAQAAREQATQAAAQRAQGFGDATVGQAAFQAELQAIEAKQALDEEYAKRQEELAGNPQALAELEAYYQQAIDAQRAAVEQQIADAQQAADLRIQAREQEKQAVIAAAEEERKAVVAERRKAQEQVAAEAEKQRAAVATKAAEQRQAVESEFQAQNDAITKWADDTERELQRVIDKADEAVRALLALGAATPKGATGQLPPGISVGTRATGGPVAAGQPYIVGEKRAELFVPETSGYVLPYVPSGGSAGGGAGATLNLTFGPGSIVQQPGEDGALLARRVAAMAYEQLRSRMQGRGF